MMQAFKEYMAFIEACLPLLLKKNGMQEQAEQEWLQASTLLDIANVSETKQLIRRSLEN